MNPYHYTKVRASKILEQAGLEVPHSRFNLSRILDQQIILGQRKFKVREKKILVNIFLKTNYFGKIVESEGLFVSKKIWFQYFFVKQNT